MDKQLLLEVIMKKAALILTLLLSVFTLASCRGDVQHRDADPDHITLNQSQNEPLEDDSDGLFKATVGILKDDMLILYTNEPAGIYTLSLSGLKLIECKKGDVVPGMEIEVEYSGMIMESYPAKLSEPKSLKITGGEANNICQLYLNIALKLWEEDPGLNGSVCALEIKDDTISENQKRVVAYELENRLGFETSVVLSSREEREAEGLIDKENLYFKDGALLTIAADKESHTGDGFNFTAQKWASGTGAIFFFNCKATRSNGIWDYELGGFAIS